MDGDSMPTSARRTLDHVRSQRGTGDVPNRASDQARVDTTYIGEGIVQGLGCGLGIGYRLLRTDVVRSSWTVRTVRDITDQEAPGSGVLDTTEQVIRGTLRACQPIALATIRYLFLIRLTSDSTGSPVTSRGLTPQES